MWSLIEFIRWKTINTSAKSQVFEAWNTPGIVLNEQNITLKPSGLSSDILLLSNNTCNIPLPIYAKQGFHDKGLKFNYHNSKKTHGAKSVKKSMPVMWTVINIL